MSASSTWHGEVPKRPALQRREALVQANRVRTQRARLKADLKGDRRSLADLIADPPEYLASAKLTEVLAAVPKYGRIKTIRLLERCRVSPKKTIGGLSQRQRRELIKELEG